MDGLQVRVLSGGSRVGRRSWCLGWALMSGRAAWSWSDPSARKSERRGGREFVPCTTTESAPCAPPLGSAPLFEEEGDPRGLALIAQRDDPIFLYGAGVGPGLAPHDCPVDSCGIEVRDGGKGGLRGKQMC